MGKINKLGGCGFHHVAIRASNFEATVKFYTEGFGFTERLSWGEGDRRAVLLDTGDGDYLEVFAGGVYQGLSREVLLSIWRLRTDDGAVHFFETLDCFFKRSLTCLYTINRKW
ncbi:MULTISPECIES: VOC family protein [unclassified Paenibacillus]|uniref:VOC family protein n=1 Tax=unclassified Paenibacillus TaxID=185978 RepID=UPI00070981EF|nr:MULTISPECIES: VOC family protein [unclassified Paenibacillus]KQX48346.1 hypothetical protein ASD40_09045 [Paenibacillus sp. Root444D2]KRE46825.1 hypothetical protein ASG85_28655 [Paenibacillus sp. Soil724D2]